MRRRVDLVFPSRGLVRVMLAGTLAVSGILGLAGCNTEPFPPSVRLGNTVITGVNEPNGIAAFLGLPFAEPPVGERRWARPVPWQPDGQAIDASSFAPACMQTDSGVNWYRGMMTRVGIDPNLMVAPQYSEDCLYLNVWADLEADEPLPVMLYIHGGGNKGGWSYEPNYHGEQLARQGMVVVSVAYRLGIFGWLNHPEMTIKNPALHDLATGLEWVHEYIAAFGGDPDRITVVGESAGADNAIHLAISPLSQGRVRGLIQQSGGWSFDEGPDTQAAEAYALNFQRALLGETGSLDALREIPSAQLLEAAGEVYSSFYFDPVEDPESLPNTLPKLSEGGSLPVIDTIIGTNLNEALMYIPSEFTPLENFGGRLSEEVVGKIFGEFPQEVPVLDRMDRVGTGIQYLCPSLALASALDTAGARVWVYRFDRVRPGFEPIGAYHGAELPYMFDQHDDWLPSTNADRRITKEMVAHWSAFIRRGDPFAEGAPDWPQWRADSPQMIRYGDATTDGLHPDLAFCENLRSHYLPEVTR
ncbi:MAG: carboxylesterase/lipase family protein [Luminiphilus sp.]